MFAAESDYLTVVSTEMPYFPSTGQLPAPTGDRIFGMLGLYSRSLKAILDVKACGLTSTSRFTTSRYCQSALPRARELFVGGIRFGTAILIIEILHGDGD